MSSTLNEVLFHLASGDAFFSGLITFTVAAVALVLSRHLWIRLVAYGGCIMGIALVALSGTPLPTWAYSALAFVGAATLAIGFRRRQSRALRVGLVLATAVVAVGAMALELPYRFTPSMGLSNSAQTLYVIGDSVSAGIGAENGNTWPVLLRKERGVDVVDFSRGGATAESALRSLKDRILGPGIVVLEIGGNDMLGRADPAEFERDLDALLAHATGVGRQLVMFELPVLPLENDYGRVQRTLAARYGITLIPKRRFVEVLAGPNATVDGIHLTERGQRHMARVIGEVLFGS